MSESQIITFYNILPLFYIAIGLYHEYRLVKKCNKIISEDKKKPKVNGMYDISCKNAFKITEASKKYTIEKIAVLCLAFMIGYGHFKYNNLLFVSSFSSILLFIVLLIVNVTLFYFVFPDIHYLKPVSKTYEEEYSDNDSVHNVPVPRHIKTNIFPYLRESKLNTFCMFLISFIGLVLSLVFVLFVNTLFM
mgnify:CR=1 FL=1